MSYWEMVRELSKLGVDMYIFKEFVVFRNRLTKVEFELSREDIPRKNATVEQCEKAFDLIKEKLVVDYN